MKIPRANAHVRWVDYSRRSMQRVGFLKIVLGLTSPSEPQTLGSLSKSFAAHVTRRVPVQSDRQKSFTEYVRRQKIKRYSAEADTAEIQDVHLSDERLPSHTGAITGDLEQRGYRHSVYVDIPTWAAKLQLLRFKNYTLTDRGKVFLTCDSKIPSSDEVPENPFLLDVSQRYIFLYCLIDADGDLLREMFKELGLRSFSRSEAGEAIAAALRTLRSRFGHSSSGPTQQAQLRIERAISALAQQKGQGLGPRESIATPRTEPLVDCGIFEKPNPEQYEYRPTPWGAAFIELMRRADSVSAFLETGLTAAMAAFASRDVAPNPADVTAVMDAYDNLRSGLGYVSLRELALASVARALAGSQNPLFEISAVESAIRAASAEGLARLALGREPGNAQVKLDVRRIKNRGSRV